MKEAGEGLEVYILIFSPARGNRKAGLAGWLAAVEGNKECKVREGLVSTGKEGNLRYRSDTEGKKEENVLR